ncbi:MAG TPA: SRPBCC family protein [Candidatus Limnocylindrales bacterium]
MIRVEREIEVDRPAEEVFARLTRIEDLPNWQPAIREAAITSPGPLGAGSTIRLVVDAAGQQTEAHGRVVDYGPPERIALEASAGPADLSAAVKVTPIDAGRCAVWLGTDIKLGGLLRFAEGMVRGRIEAEAPEAAAHIKSWLESD